MISVLLTVCMVLSLFAVAAVSVGAEEGTSFYLVGSMTDPQWEINEAYKLTLNTAAQGEEYMINNVYLESGTEFKVANADKTAWYPDGTDNNYQIESNGYFDIYFRPDSSGNTAYGWHYGTILAQRVYAVLKGYTTTVADSVALNFYMYLDETNLPDSATLTWGEGNRAKEVTVNRNNFSETQDYQANYKFTADVAAVSMNDEVTLTLTYADSPEKAFTGSVVKYCNLLKDNENTTEPQKKALDNMLDYGAAVQQYFNYRTDDLANGGNYQNMFLPDFDDHTDFSELNNNDALGVKFKGAILSMTSKLALRLYFDIQDTEDLLVVVDGPGDSDDEPYYYSDEQLHYDESRSLYYVEINQIPSCRLFGSDNRISLAFLRFRVREDDVMPEIISEEMTYNVDHYASKVVNNNEYNENFKNVMNRLYYYSTTIGAAFNISAQ